jgi:hypothetical protein
VSERSLGKRKTQNNCQHSFYEDYFTWNMDKYLYARTKALRCTLTNILLVLPEPEADPMVLKPIFDWPVVGASASSDTMLFIKRMVDASEQAAYIALSRYSVSCKKAAEVL